MYGISKFDAKWCIEYQMDGEVINVIGIKLMEVKLLQHFFYGSNEVIYLWSVFHNFFF